MSQIVAKRVTMWELFYDLILLSIRIQPLAFSENYGKIEIIF